MRQKKLNFFIRQWERGWIFIFMLQSRGRQHNVQCREASKLRPSKQDDVYKQQWLQNWKRRRENHCTNNGWKIFMKISFLYCWRIQKNNVYNFHNCQFISKLRSLLQKFDSNFFSSFHCFVNIFTISLRSSAWSTIQIKNANFALCILLKKHFEIPFFSHAHPWRRLSVKAHSGGGSKDTQMENWKVFFAHATLLILCKPH